jgi:glucose-1-phosphatase
VSDAGATRGSSASQISGDASDVEVILFDVGGVLVELDGVRSILEWTSGRLSTDEIWRLWLYSPAVRAFETGRMDAEAFAAGILAELALEIEPTRFLESFLRWPTRLYPGALELVARIPARYQRALLSNSNALHWPRVIDEMRLGEVFEHRFVSHLTGKIKPDRDAFEHVLETLACRPQQVLFLDDNAPNVEVARSIGMHAAVVRGVLGAEEALTRLGVLVSAPSRIAALDPPG